MTINRLISGAVSITAAVSLGFAGAAVTTLTIATPAHAASTAGGQITPAEILARAQYWVDQGYTYLNSSDRSTWRTGPAGSERYRRDCSGLVSMVWHLPEDYYDTSVFESWIGTKITRLGGFNDLKPGDAILRVGYKGLSDHMELFAFWKNNDNHAEGAYFYSFNETGETVRNPYKQSNNGKLGFRSLSDITTNFEHAIHYNKNIDDVRPVVDPQAGRLVDFDGDGRTDVLGLGVGGNDLWMVPGTSTPGNPSRGQSIHLSDGWKTVTRYWVADYDSDGKTDLLGLNG
ncbi:VCBS repeat-containing protein, partial [Microbispora sp. NPDC046973]|uniref:FG-GAP repeat domain-containing protein n=1 Tax=Microbispora sp. NPDC046973 TaxID=3155022 RepID=UPI0033C6C4D3